MWSCKIVSCCWQEINNKDLMKSSPINKSSIIGHEQLTLKRMFLDDFIHISDLNLKLVASETACIVWEGMLFLYFMSPFPRPHKHTHTHTLTHTHIHICRLLLAVRSSICYSRQFIRIVLLPRDLLHQHVVELHEPVVLYELVVALH